MIVNIQRVIESYLINYSSEVQGYSKLIEVLNKFSVYYTKWPEGDYCTIEISSQKITLDEFQMQELFSNLSRLFSFRLVYCNMGFEDFYIYVYPTNEKDD